MSVLTTEFCDFLRELQANNSKAWFDENRKRYEQHVKKPFSKLVADLLPHMQSLDAQIDMQAKEAIFRINRDIRFSADKSPYNTTMKAAFVRGGRKSVNAGFFLGVSADQIHLGGGAYGPDKAGINAIRSAIAAAPSGFGGIYRSTEFSELFGPVQGSRLKRIPPEFREAQDAEPLIANKQWYVMRAESVQPLLKNDKLEERILQVFAAAEPLMSFLNAAIEQPADV